MALQEGFVRKDEVRQKLLIDELIATELPFFLGLIQQVLKDNGGKYLVGSEVWFSIICAYISRNIDIDFWKAIINIISYFCITADMGRFNVGGFPWDDCYWTCSDAGIQKSIGVGELQILIRLQKSDRTSSQDKRIPSEETKYRILMRFCHFRNSGKFWKIIVLK